MNLRKYLCTNFNSFNMTCTVVQYAISDHNTQILSLSLQDYRDNYVFIRFLSTINYNIFESHMVHLLRKSYSNFVDSIPIVVKDLCCLLIHNFAI